MRAVNLVPPERRSGASVGLGRSGGGAYAVLGLVVAVALLVLLYGSARHQISSNKAQAQKLAAEASQAESQAGSLTRYNALNALSQARTQAVEQLVDTRFDWAHSFHELGRVLPKQVSIASLTGTVGSDSEKSTAKAASNATAVTSATPPGSVPTFVLTGCAANQVEVAQMLERLRLADGVKEATLQSSVGATPASGGSGGGSGTCPGSDPTFSVSIVFEPLPASVPKATSTVSDTEGATK